MTLKLFLDSNVADGGGADSFTVCAPDDEVNDLTLVGHEDMLADKALLLSGRRTSKTPGGAENDGSPNQMIWTRRKANIAKSACVQCQKRKTRCSGRRPLCHSCNDRSLSCFWDTGDGLTRTADLKKKLCEAIERSDNLDTLVNAMRHGTDQASSMLLAKLRFGMSLQDLLDGIHPESLAMDANSLDMPEDAAYPQLPLIPLLSELSALECDGDMWLADVYHQPVTGSNKTVTFDRYCPITYAPGSSTYLVDWSWPPLFRFMSNESLDVEHVSSNATRPHSFLASDKASHEWLGEKTPPYTTATVVQDLTTEG